MRRTGWALKLLATLVLAALLTACGAGVSDPPRLVLPPLKEYSREFQNQVAKEIERHGADAPGMTEMVNDYGDLRSAIRAAGKK